MGFLSDLFGGNKEDKALREALPPQPWRPGVHAAVAKELDVKPQRVSNAIQILVSRGTFMQQRDGVVYDSAGNEVARDATRYRP